MASLLSSFTTVELSEAECTVSGGYAKTPYLGISRKRNRISSSIHKETNKRRVFSLYALYLLLLPASSWWEETRGRRGIGACSPCALVHFPRILAAGNVVKYHAKGRWTWM